MTRALPLRPYQRDAIDALHKAFAGQRRPTGHGSVNRAAVVLPTGMGKTVIFSHLAAEALDRRQRPLVLVHREELAHQAREKIHSVVPGASVGIVKADRDDVEADIVVASIQTLARQARRSRIRNVGIGIVDEAHHSSAATWRATMEHFGAWSDVPWAGFTATMHRDDGQHLGDIWQEIVFRRDIIDGISAGHLVNVRGKRIYVNSLELDEVKRSRGDLQLADLGDAMINADAGNTIAKAYVEHASDRQGVVFAPTVPTAVDFAETLNHAGVPTEIITGTTPEDERTAIYERYRTGATQVLSNCMVLTEGWDAPWASCAVIARPTESAALYTQMVGRVLRPWPAGGKRDALVLDVVGASARHRLATLADLTVSPITELDDGESLAEAAERAKAQKSELAPTILDPYRLDGDLAAEDVDLFAASDSLWLQTPAGVWFIPAGDDIFFLWPRGDGTFTLGQRNIRKRGLAAKLEDGLTLDYGMAWAESYATDVDASLSRKTASWRKGNRPPSMAQVDFAAKLGIATDGLNKRQVSDAISIRLATAALGG